MTESCKTRAPRGRPKDLGKRQAILQAAADLFMANGPDAVSMDDIAKAAGVAKLTLYSHFDTKDALFQQIIIDKCHEHDVNGRFDDLAQLPPREALHRLGQNFIQLILSPEALSMHRIIEGGLASPKMARVFHEAGPVAVKKEFSKLAQRWQKQGQMSTRWSPDDLADMFFCLIKGMLHMELVLGLRKRPSAADIKAYAALRVDLFLAAVAPENP